LLEQRAHQRAKRNPRWVALRELAQLATAEASATSLHGKSIAGVHDFLTDAVFIQQKQIRVAFHRNDLFMPARRCYRLVARPEGGPFAGLLRQRGLEQLNACALCSKVLGVKD
jgi:hypothetical protein